MAAYTVNAQAVAGIGPQWDDCHRVQAPSPAAVAMETTILAGGLCPSSFITNQAPTTSRRLSETRVAKAAPVPPQVGMTATLTMRFTTSAIDSPRSQAYSLYLEGRYLWNKRPGDVVWQALDRFERAIAVDPDFAPAHAALASVYGTLGAWEFGVLPPAEALSKAKAAAKRALELDPQLAAGHTAVAYATLHFDWDAERACRQLTRRSR